MRPYNSLLCILFVLSIAHFCAAQSGGRVRVKFSILDGPGLSSATIGQNLQNMYIANSIAIGYPVVNLSVIIPNSNASSSSTTGSTVSTSVGSSSTTGQHSTGSVQGSNYQFTPSTLQINVGDTVTWTWIGTHNIAQSTNSAAEDYDGSGFRSGNPTTDGQYSHTFNTAGTYSYICEPHASLGMKGVITVGPSATSTSTSSSTSGETNPEASSSPAMTASPVMVGTLAFLFSVSKKESVAVALFMLLINGATAFRSYTNCKVIMSEVNYRFYWTLDAPYIRIGVQADTQGWIAMGISQNGLMSSGGNAPGSDIYMAFSNSAYAPCVNGCIHDYYTLKYNLPILDSVQNVNMVSFQEVGQTTWLEFDRLLTATDSNNDLSINTAVPTWFLFAVQTQTKPANESVFTKHDYRTPMQIDLNQKSECPVGITVDVEVELNIDPANFNQTTFISNMATQLGVADTWRLSVVDIEEQDPVFCPTCTTLEFKFPDFAVPTADTTYECYGFAFPTTGKYQIIRFEPMIDNSLVLHHMLLYQASSQPPAGFQACSMLPSGSTPIWAWAPGGQPMDLPAVAGVPIGAGSSTQFGILQIHYNNPQRTSGHRDSSGVRMYLTTTLRQYDAGFVFLGVGTGDVSVSPGYTDWTMSGTCDSSVTTFIPTSQPLNVFAVASHMHLYGKSLWTEHYDSTGARLPDLGGTQHYDFNAQSFTMVNKQIKHNDKLITRCVWDSSDTATAINGCEATTCEMCIMAIMYYPKSPTGLVQCTASWTPGCNLKNSTCCNNCTSNLW